MKKIKVFLGAYINSINAQNLNCLALAKYLDKDKFEIYTLEVYSGNLINSSMNEVKFFRCLKPFKFFQYLGFLWGIWNADVAYLPKRELIRWNRFIARIFRTKTFKTIESSFDELNTESFVTYFGNYQTFLDSFKGFDRSYSITKFSHDYNLEKHGIITQDKILYLGAELDVFLQENKQNNIFKNVLFIGRLFKRKGIYEILELAKQFKQLNFHFVGNGSEEEILKTIIQKDDLKNIIFHGTLSHHDIARLLGNMDLHLFPSRSEGFPKVTLETAAAGVPSLVYSDYGASEWITDHKDGFVVETLDEMKETIQELLYNPELLRETSKNSIVMAKRFDWEVLVKDWEAVIVELAKKNKR